MTDSVHIVGDGLTEGHIYLFCADNLTQIFCIEGTTTSSADVSHFFFWPDQQNALKCRQ